MKKSLFILVLLCNLTAFGQNSKFVVDTIEANGLTYIGHTMNGNNVGLWSGRDSLSDSVHVYARFTNGRLQETFVVHPTRGLLVTNRLNATQDTLLAFTYGRDGALLYRIEYFANDTSKWRLNTFTPATSNGESGLKSVRRCEWYYDYEDIPGFTLVQEINSGSANYLHYYFNGKFVCTVNSKGKVIRGDAKLYRKIIAK